MKRVSPAEAKALLDEGWTYVDVRSEPEFDHGHPAGALNIPLLRATPAGMIPNQDFLKVTQAVLERQSKIVIGCQSGGRSMRAAAMLEAAGYQNIVEQRAGFGGAFDASGRIVEPGWRAQSLPVESGQPPGRSYADLVKSGSKFA